MIEPSHDCPLCPRLAGFRADNRRQFPTWFNGPVPVWGAAGAQLVIVGLAPGLKGANRTGRPFTGDYAGDLLYATLLKLGAASGRYDPTGAGDTLRLEGAAIVNAVRCVPPQNKPTPAEIATCRRFLAPHLTPRPKVFLALGHIAHQSLLTALDERRSSHRFAHGAEHRLSDGTRLFDSYHCSRYNTNTGVLTPAMFEDVVGRAVEAAKAD